jgi:hypothetical protein
MALCNAKINFQNFSTASACLYALALGSQAVFRWHFGISFLMISWFLGFMHPLWLYVMIL